jgi:coenzyme Q-binding protein COQ10
MFDLVADVERYPEFVPLCDALDIISRQDTETGADLVARMTVGNAKLRETFTTQVTLNKSQHSIDVSYLDGPFRHLINRWRFEAAGEGACDIDFFIDYEFKSMLLSALLGGVFDKAFRRFTEAFEDRADVVYGVPSDQTMTS